MADKAWKALERRVAAFLGGTRNRMSGAVDQLTAGDVVHDTLYVEVKQRSTLALDTWMTEAVASAKSEVKTPIMALHRKGSKTVIYAFREKDAEFVCVEVLRRFGWEFD
ncbi:hypothetical protein LCGC14_2865790 [marine sediment metagenome]|uniref:Holliday junction resolvase n=1 Tax=marine sediment metagenome TaxID=412755 RepID=A0A0F8YR11_9ZZZZ